MKIINNMCNMIKEKINIEVPTVRIDDIYQIANTDRRGRVYKVVFTSLKSKETIHRARTSLGQGHNLFINEDLTPGREKLAFQARDLRRKKLIANTWTRNGDIYIKEHVAQK